MYLAMLLDIMAKENVQLASVQLIHHGISFSAVFLDHKWICRQTSVEVN